VTGEEIDIAKTNRANDDGTNDKNADQEENEPVGNEATSEQDWTQDLVMNSVEGIVEIVQCLVDEVVILGLVLLVHT